MSQVVLLGIASSFGAETPWPPDAGSTKRFAALADLEPEFVGKSFGLDNLFLKPDPTRSDLREAAERYRFLPGWWYLLAGTEVVRALGKRASPARSGKLPWHTQGPPVLRWYASREDVTMAVLPHPSGKNRWYNDARCRRAAERFVRDAVGAERELRKSAWASERFRRESDRGKEWRG